MYSSNSFSLGAVFTCPKQHPHTDQLSGRMEPGGNLSRPGFPLPAPGAVHLRTEKRLPSGDPLGFQRSSFTSRVPCVSFFKTESASRAWWRSLSSQHSGGEGKKSSNSRTARLHNRPSIRKKRTNWVWWRAPLTPELEAGQPGLYKETLLPTSRCTPKKENKKTVIIRFHVFKFEY